MHQLWAVSGIETVRFVLWQAERDNAEVRISDVASYQKVVDAEWDIIYDKLAKIVASGANIILSKLAIGDLATQYFADRGLFCAGRVEDGDIKRMAKATGAQMQTSCNDLSETTLGHCKSFEEKQVGGERFNFFSGCKAATTCTIVLRGGAEQFIAEAERSLHDAIMNTRRLLKNPEVIAGGGAIEMELSAHLREHSRTIHGKSQLLIAAFAKALEVIPRQVSANAGMDPTDVLNKLRMKHAHGGTWFGVDVVECGVCDTMESFVWEATVMKRNALQAACEAACAHSTGRADSISTLCCLHEAAACCPPVEKACAAEKLWTSVFKSKDSFLWQTGD